MLDEPSTGSDMLPAAETEAGVMVPQQQGGETGGPATEIMVTMASICAAATAAVPQCAAEMPDQQQHQLHTPTAATCTDACSSTQDARMLLGTHGPGCIGTAHQSEERVPGQPRLMVLGPGLHVDMGGGKACNAPPELMRALEVGTASGCVLL